MKSSVSSLSEGHILKAPKISIKMDIKSRLPRGAHGNVGSQSSRIYEVVNFSHLNLSIFTALCLLFQCLLVLLCSSLSCCVAFHSAQPGLLSQARIQEYPSAVQLFCSGDKIHHGTAFRIRFVASMTQHVVLRPTLAAEKDAVPPGTAAKWCQRGICAARMDQIWQAHVTKQPALLTYVLPLSTPLNQCSVMLNYMGSLVKTLRWCLVPI